VEGEEMGEIGEEGKCICAIEGAAEALVCSKCMQCKRATQTCSPLTTPASAISLYACTPRSQRPPLAHAPINTL
jgi:hypothetical protein